tara:strand:- start:56 stop:1282 length:1227 start_codon:yes stop_codon:yes gene_type:complete
MMELALLKTLLNKEFYNKHKGLKCPDKIFSKDVRKIKQALDTAMETYDSDLSVADLQAVFNRINSSMTTATSTAYEDLFKRIDIAEPIKQEIANDTLSQLFQQYVGDRVANLGFDFVNGSENSLEPLRKLLEEYKDDFTPNTRIEWDDHSFDTVLALSQQETKWKINIPPLADRVEGISGGHFIVVGARPNTGKTSFHASLIAAEGGFAEQGAKCILLTNEEAYNRVVLRYIGASSKMCIKEELPNNIALARSRYKPVADKINIKDSTGKDMSWVESVVKQERPDIVILDMGDKFAPPNSNDRPDITLRIAAIHARNIAKEYNCAVFWMSQLSAEAQDKTTPNMSMLEGSKTGKAAEADLMILIGMAAEVEGEENNGIRYINVAKNKLTGWHGRINAMLDVKRGIYTR